MAVRSSASQTGVGASTALTINHRKNPKVSYVVIVSGTVVYSVQHSLDGINFMDNSDVTSQSTNKDGNYIFPVEAVRVNVESGSGTATLTVLQEIDI